MRSITTLAARARLVTVASLVGAVGCGVMPAPPRPPDVQPDLAAIATVIDDAYRKEGFSRPVLFLETGEVCDSISPTCVPSEGGVSPALKAQLETDLQVKVRALSEADLADPFVPALTPVLPETGEVGVSISLGRFSVDNGGLLRVSVTVARSGLNGVGMEYVLEPADDGWAIREIHDGGVA